MIGVVSNAHDLGVETEAEPVLYFPGFGVHAVLLIRTNTDPKSIVPEVRNAVRELDPTQPIYHVETIDEVLSDSLARQRMIAVLLGIFASAGADACSHRHLWGHRLFRRAAYARNWGADGGWSSRANILLLILREAASLTGIGVLAGLIAAFAARIWSARFCFRPAVLTRSPSAYPCRLC